MELLHSKSSSSVIPEQCRSKHSSQPVYRRVLSLLVYLPHNWTLLDYPVLKSSNNWRQLENSSIPDSALVYRRRHFTSCTICKRPSSKRISLSNRRIRRLLRFRHILAESKIALFHTVWLGNCGFCWNGFWHLADELPVKFVGTEHLLF